MYHSGFEFFKNGLKFEYGLECHKGTFLNTILTYVQDFISIAALKWAVSVAKDLTKSVKLYVVKKVSFI